MTASRRADVAYCAGLFEGEGTIRVDRHYWTRTGEKRERVTPQVKVRIGMTDREPLERFQSVFGGRFHGPYHAQKGTKVYWILDVDSPPTVRAALAAMYPLLSPRRQRQVDAAIPSLLRAA